MKIVESFLIKNDCYKNNVNRLDDRYKKFQDEGAKGLMLHSVGCNQPSASVFAKNWNRAGLEKCVHAFIDAKTGDVYQTLPWNYRGWHGGGASNNTHIGVEMCEPDCIKYTGGSSFTCSDTAKAKEMVQRTYNTAVELFAFLCKKHNLDPMKNGVIIGHKEGHKLGIASNHGDPEHLWKGLGLPYTMDTFRKAVKDCTNPPAPSTKFPATPFMVNVIISNLNIRSKPSMSGAVKGKTGKGVFTITEVSGDWGKLKSNKGWIFISNPDYCTIKTEVQKKSVEAVAKEVILGKWGNGSARKKKLTEAGYDYSEVQKMVNKLLAK